MLHYTLSRYFATAKKERAHMGILYEKRGRVATITINRPEARNAIDLDTSRELAQAWQDFRDDDEVWIGVLTGAGDKAFSAGADLKSLIPMLSGAARDNGTADASGFGGNHHHFEWYKPIIAAVHGFRSARCPQMMSAFGPAH